MFAFGALFGCNAEQVGTGEGDASSDVNKKLKQDSTPSSGDSYREYFTLDFGNVEIANY